MDRSHAVILGLLWGCSGGQPPSLETAQLAATVISAPRDTGQGFRDVQRAINGVRGGGATQGSLDVYSLSLQPDDELVLAFDAPVLDGEGPDLVVFENAFEVASGEGRYMDPVVVEVSADGEDFVAFPHSYGLTDYSSEPSDWVGFAGITPVLLHEEDHPVDPLSPEAGGDAFDLSLLEPPLDEIRFVRLTAAATWLDPETGVTFPVERVSNGPDIDGVYARAP